MSFSMERLWDEIMNEVIELLLEMPAGDAQAAIIAYCNQRADGVGEDLLDALEEEFGSLF